MKLSLRSLARRSAVAGSLIALAVGGVVATAPTASAATYVDGFDVSHYQGSINWAAQYSAGARFAYMKATEGTSYIDSTFSANYTNSYNAGFIRGAYHFAVPDASSGATQANYFLAHGGGWSSDGKTMPPMIDLENESGHAACFGLSQSAMTNWIADFSNTIHNATHKYPMIYTQLSWWQPCTGNTSAFAATNPFFLARYSTSQPPLPAGTAAWTIWQYASSGKWPGDQDYFNGSYTQLQALATNADN